MQALLGLDTGRGSGGAGGLRGGTGTTNGGGTALFASGDGRGGTHSHALEAADGKRDILEAFHTLPSDSRKVHSPFRFTTFSG